MEIDIFGGEGSMFCEGLGPSPYMGVRREFGVSSALLLSKTWSYYFNMSFIKDWERKMADRPVPQVVVRLE